VCNSVSAQNNSCILLSLFTHNAWQAGTFEKFLSKEPLKNKCMAFHLKWQNRTEKIRVDKYEYDHRAHTTAGL